MQTEFANRCFRIVYCCCLPGTPHLEIYNLLNHFVEMVSSYSDYDSDIDSPNHLEIFS